MAIKGLDVYRPLPKCSIKALYNLRGLYPTHDKQNTFLLVIG